MSLRIRAMVILGAIEAVTLAILIAASLTYLHRAGLTQAQQHAEALRLIRAAVAESLFVVNEHSAAEVIDSAFHEIPAITYLQITGDDGRLIAEKRKGSDLTGRALYLHDSIELGGVEFGKLHMHFSTAQVFQSTPDQLVGRFPPQQSLDFEAEKGGFARTIGTAQGLVGVGGVVVFSIV